MDAHVPTLFLMMITVSGVLAVSVGLVARAQLRDGMAYCAVGLGFHTGAYLLYMLRGQISDMVSIVLANVMMASVFALFTEGVYQFQKRKPWHAAIWLPVPLVAVVFTALLPWQAARVVAGTLIFSAQSAAIVVALLQKRRITVGIGQYFLVTGFLMLIAALAFQGICTVVLMHEILSIKTPHLVQTITFLVSAMCVVMVSLGLVVMTKERADERNRNLAMKDELTGLINRRSLLESLAQQISAAKRNGQPLSLLMMDIDYFKRVNDNHGHLSGDKVLKTMANVVSARARAQDLLGRLGGEEFLMLLPDTSVQGALQLAEALRKSVEDTSFHSVSGQAVSITVSIGLCELSQLSESRCDDMISAADRALYRAKEAGRNRVEVFSDAPADAGLAVK